MRLSMDILAEELKDLILSAHIPEDSGLELEGVRFLEENDDMLCSHLLYIGTWIPSTLPSRFHMLYLGSIPGGALPESCSVLALDAGCGERAVLNRVLGAFQKYNDWYDTLQRMLADRASFQAFLDVSQPIFRCGICLMDWDHNCVAVTRLKIENSPLWDAILDGYGYKYKFVIEHSNPKLSDITKSKKISQNWSNLDNRYLYNSTLYVNGLPMYGIGLHKIEQPDLPFGRHIKQLFEVLLDTVGQRLNDESGQQLTRGVLYDVFIRDVINGKVKNPDELNASNEFICFAPDDRLAVGVVVFKNINYRSEWLVNCSKELENLWPGSVCTVVDCQLLWIVNLKETFDFQMIANSLKKRIQQWMIDRVARCGFSPSFCGLTTLRLRYHQAISALHYGLACGEENLRPVYTYFEHLDYQLLNLASTSTDLTDLVHPTLRVLLAFDQTHKTNYYETLKCYLLNEYSLTFNEMADKLHVHRNTFHYRLDKIQEIAGISFKDHSAKTQLLLSIYCFDLFPSCTYEG